MPGHRAATASAASSSARQSRISFDGQGQSQADEIRFLDHDTVGGGEGDEGDDDDNEIQPQDTWQNVARRIESVPVYPILQLLRHDICATIDTGLTWEELVGHDLNFAIVRPLARKYSKLRSPAILYALLVTRIHFLREADRDLANQNISHTRADLCELLAIKLLRTFAGSGMELVTALGAPFWPFSGAKTQILDDAQKTGAANQDPVLEATSTLQLSVYSSAKRFVATPLVQKCIDGIWRGQVVLGNSSTTGHAIINDSYKKHPVSIYNPAKAPFLDHRRLRVPRVRAFLEAANFVAILFAYINCLRMEGTDHWTAPETIFSVWLLGLAVDELAQIQEHGWSVYMSSLFNVLDGLFCVVGFVWFGIRMSGLAVASSSRNNFAFDVLSLGAILLCPRIASLLVSDNVLLLALRAMVVEFSYFLGLALVFFAGFLWTFWSLSDSRKWTPATIGWLMLRFTFGNTISFEEAQEFSPTFGPWLVVAFTILAQTLLLTILISLLSATFARVAEHAQEESLFQHAYSTLQGVSSEALFSYVPPLNLLCILIVLPASFVLSPRWLHKINVFVIRVTHLPILFAIRLMERGDYWNKSVELLTQNQTNERSPTRGRVFQAFRSITNRWKHNKHRTQSDLISAVFVHIIEEEENAESDSDDESPEEMQTQGGGILRRRKALRKRRTEANVDEDDANKTSTPKAKRSHSATGDPYGSIHPRFADGTNEHSHALNRVMTTESMPDNLPDSPGATIRRLRAAYETSSKRNSSLMHGRQDHGRQSRDGTQSPSAQQQQQQPTTASVVTGLSRHDTFASLFSPRTQRTKRGKSGADRRGRPSRRQTADSSPQTTRYRQPHEGAKPPATTAIASIAEGDGVDKAHGNPSPRENEGGTTEGSTEHLVAEERGEDENIQAPASQRRSEYKDVRSRSQSRSRYSRSRASSASSSRDTGANEGGNEAENDSAEDDRDDDDNDSDDDDEAASLASERRLEDVMLGFLERLDEQATTNERIEALLLKVLGSQTAEAAESSAKE